MARIRLGDFGNVARPAVESAKPTKSAFVAGDGAGDAAVRVAGAMVDQQRTEQLRIEREQDAERKASERELRRAKGVEAYAGYQADLDDFTDGLTKQLAGKQVTRDKVPELFATGIEDLKKKRLEGLDAEQQALMGAHFMTAERGANRRLRVALDADVKADGLATLNASQEEYQRIGAREPERAIAQWSQVLDAQGPGLLGADKVGAAKQKFAESVWYTHFAGRLTAGRDNAAALKGLEGEIAGNDTLDPDRKNKLLGDARAYQLQIDHKAQIAENRRQTLLEQAGRRLSWYVENGRDIPPGEFDSFVENAKGTPFEGFAQAVLAEQKDVAELAKLPPDQQVARVKALEASYGATPSKEQITHLSKVKGFVDRTLKQLNESPLTYAVQRDGAKVEPLDITSPGTWSANLQSRVPVLTELSKRTGVAPKALFPEEVQAITGYMRSASVGDRRQVLNMLAQGIDDPKVFRATMQQIAPDDPVTAVAGLAAKRGLTSQGDHFIADEILRGQSLLRPNRKEDGKPGAGGALVKMPPDKDLETQFANRARDAFAGNAEAGNIFLQTAKAIYAARTDASGDLSGQLNGSRWDDAIDAATGGIEKWNGRAIAMPHGINKARFKDDLQVRVDQMLAQGQVPQGWTRDKLMDLPLQNIGDGRYVFRVGDGVLVGDVPATVDKSQWDKRADGSTKGLGFLGLLRRPDGMVSSEISIGVNIDGKEMEIPSMVPTLSKAQVDKLLTLGEHEKMPNDIVDKAVAFARQRLKAGKPVFATDDESPRATVARPIVIDFTAPLPYRTSGSR